MRIIHIFTIILAIIFSECNSESNHNLEKIDVLCDSDPHLAMTMLDSIDPLSLSESDRHYYDLLHIKSRDKAYVRHTSDSLVIDIIDYYESHQDKGLYPEALYYGGRVYSDMGDLPTTLEYFQKAIDATPDDATHLSLKSSILSQTGRLLEDIRLYKEAAQYIQKAIDISIQLKDTTNIFYDNIQLISLYKHCDSINLARKHLLEAFRYTSNSPIEDIMWLEVESASLLLHEGKTDSALMAIRPVLKSVDTLCRNYALGVASNIYMKAGIIDTTYQYSKELALSHNLNNRNLGFNVLFSPEVFPCINKDSISFFLQAYGDHINEYLDRYESEEALFQNSKYNYFLHQRERDKAEKEKFKAVKDRNKAIVFGAVAIIILLISIFHILFAKLKDEIKLRIAIHLVQTLEFTNIAEDKVNIKVNNFVSANYQKIEYRKKTLLPFFSQQENLRKELLIRLHSISRGNTSKLTIDEKINQSSVVKRLHKMLSENKGIKDSETRIWKDIENEVHRSSSEFRGRLMILTKGKITEKEYRVALLMRCGFRPKEISNLLIRGKSTATDRRRSLTKKIFGDAADISSLDAIILRI